MGSSKKPKKRNTGLYYQIHDPNSPLSRECPWCGAGIGDPCWDAQNIGRIKNVHPQRRKRR